MEDQNITWWEPFLLGRVLAHWKEKYKKWNGPRLSSTLWVKALILYWDISWDLWTVRN